MNGIIIIKKDHMGPSADQYGPHAMANTVQICDCVLTDKKDGDEVEFTGKGTLVEHDGMRFITVSQVDGADVEEMPDMPNDQQDQMNHEDMMGMDATDALAHFMQNKGK